MPSDRQHYTSYKASSPPLPTTRFRHHQHHVAPSEQLGNSIAVQHGLLPCTPLRTQSFLSSWEESAIVSPYPFQLTPSSLTMISGVAHASSSPFSSMCFDFGFLPQSELQQQPRLQSGQVDALHHHSPPARHYTTLPSGAHWTDGRLDQTYHTLRDTSQSSNRAWVQRDHSFDSTEGQLLYNGSESGLCSTIALEDSTHTAYTSPCTSPFACLSSGHNECLTGAYGDANRFSRANSPFSSHSLLFDQAERSSGGPSSKYESSPDSSSAPPSSSLCFPSKRADDDCKADKLRRHKKRKEGEEAAQERSRRLCESILLNMTVEQLERDGWQSAWPHHSQNRAVKRKKSDATSDRKGKDKQKEASVQPATDRSIVGLGRNTTASDSSFSVANDTSNRYPDEAEQRRLFVEVKQKIQAIPEAGDPARFQENGRCLVACEACKRRKMRCTNEFPHCSSCLKRGIECTYPVKARTRGRTKASGGAAKCDWIRRCASQSALGAPGHIHPHLDHRDAGASNPLGAQLSLGASSLADICRQFPQSTFAEPGYAAKPSVSASPPFYSSLDATSAATTQQGQAPSRKRAKREPVERRSRLGPASSSALRTQAGQSTQLRR